MSRSTELRKRRIPKELEENTILVSFEVVNLYTNIPQELGLGAMEYFLDNYQTSLI